MAQLISFHRNAIIVCGIMVCDGISLDGHTNVHVCLRGTVTAGRYRNVTRAPYLTPYAGAIVDKFILTDDNS